MDTAPQLTRVLALYISDLCKTHGLRYPIFWEENAKGDHDVKSVKIVAQCNIDVVKHLRL